MHRYNVLFVCIHNSARSQMAEAFLHHLSKGLFATASAGLQAGVLNPYAVKVMAEVGIDISAHKAKSLAELGVTGAEYDIVITVCDPAATCLILPEAKKVEHWSVEDPALFTGTPEEIMPKIREVRDDLRRRVEELITRLKSEPYREGEI